MATSQFSGNLFNGNVDNCQLLVIVKDEVSMKTCGFNILNSECKKILGVKCDYDLTLTTMCYVYVKTLAERLMR